jgi:hypothetical protein
LMPELTSEPDLTGGESQKKVQRNRDSHNQESKTP